MSYEINPELDLVLERTIPVSPDRVYRAWTDPELLKKWFTPAPWKTADVDIDLQPGGRFNSVMQSPEGERFNNMGCVLELIPNRKIVITDALHAGFRPSAEPFFSAIVTMEPHADGTKYTAIARHGTADNRKKHEEMGFHSGWSAALDQLVALMAES
jgi:uncharacterized protein YndB with AHSA1/START domain